jgi:hypothetical protein
MRRLIGIVIAVSGLVALIGDGTDLFTMTARPSPSLRFLLPPQEERVANFEDDDYRFFLYMLHSAQLETLSGNHQSAIRNLNIALESQPTYVKAYLARGLIYFHLRKRAWGAADMEKVLALSDDPELRRRANLELVLDKLARILAPIALIGTTAIGIFLFIVDCMGLEVVRMGRLQVMIFFAVLLVWVGTVIFFIGYGFIDFLIACNKDLQPEAWFRCSHKYTPCHVPKLNLPLVIGTVTELPNNEALMCAGISSDPS